MNRVQQPRTLLVLAEPGKALLRDMAQHVLEEKRRILLREAAQASLIKTDSIQSGQIKQITTRLAYYY